MRWGRKMLRNTSTAASGGSSLHIVFLLIASLMLGFMVEDRNLPRLDGGDIATVKMTYDQVARERKTGLLKKAVLKTRVLRPAKRDIERPAAAHPSPRTTIALANFYGALRGLDEGTRSEPVTILHLGDSHIASDRFSGDMRELLQARFGNAGRGMMMPGFPFGYYRARGVTFTKSPGWKAHNSLHKGNGPYGLSGVKMTAGNRGAWLQLASKAGAFEWADVAFLTGPKRGRVKTAVDNTTKTVSTRSETAGVLYERIPVKGTKLRLLLEGNGPVTILSLAVGASRPGVRYVNFGIPSATASITGRWDDVIVSEDLKRLTPDLIVLGYGTNEGFNDELRRDVYERQMTEFIVKLQRLQPGADVLVIGPPDGARYPRKMRRDTKTAGLTGAGCRALSGDETKSYSKLVRSGDRRLARWHPPPKLAVVRSALKSAAANTGSYFWVWSCVMGGACGIHDWVKAAPKLAASDHVHITSAGSKQSAEALFTQLMAGFTAHRLVAQR